LNPTRILVGDNMGVKGSRRKASRGGNSLPNAPHWRKHKYYLPKWKYRV
jgi:hypothetical protein